MMDTTSKKILIVEDEVALVKVLVSKLEREGWSVAVAYNGAEGLEMAKELHPDLILLDIIMPRMDGMTMLKELRRNGWGKTAKVILLTNLSDEFKAEEAERMGVFDYLVKSNWKIADLITRIRGRLGE
jgi:CheY-like chemotaxis protein